MTDFNIHGALTEADVPDVRRFVEKVHKRRVPGEDDLARVSMAAHELLDNAIKFSTDGAASLNIEIIGGTEVHIKTRNRARVEDLAGLQRIAEGLNTSADPMSYYLELMGSNPGGRGGLGLGRVAAEGEMQLQLKLDGDVVEVHARATLEKPVQ
ncbi:MAG: hypothetical protein SFX73_18740 [Kofleriaceae bacterium]|nr:hypothetical protein [Kofleriaceae bacterium]